MASLVSEMAVFSDNACITCPCPESPLSTVTTENAPEDSSWDDDDGGEEGVEPDPRLRRQSDNFSSPAAAGGAMLPNDDRNLGEASQQSTRRRWRRPSEETHLVLGDERSGDGGSGMISIGRVDQSEGQIEGEKVE